MNFKAASRFVVVSSYFPPVVGGTSTVMRNLLSAFRPETFSIVSETAESFDGQHNAGVPPGIEIRRTGVSALITKKLPYGVRLARWCRFALIPRIESIITAEVRRLGAERIIAVYPSWPFLIAGFKVAQTLKLPLVTYYMDVSAQVSELRWPDQPAVRIYEEKILRNAAQRLVLSEAIAEDYESRWDLSSIVIPHSIDLSQLPTPKDSSKTKGSSRSIVHTGVVEHLQSEGLLRIAQMLQKHPELNAKMILSTPTAKSDLLSRGFDLPCVEIVTLTQTEVYDLQRQADLLIAVLPFQGRISAYQRTAFPTKVVEYMAAGRPILAHAPANSFFGCHVQQHGYARLVAVPDEKELFTAISELLNDSAQRSTLVMKAGAAVNRIFDITQVAARFAHACGLDPQIVKTID